MTIKSLTADDLKQWTWMVYLAGDNNLEAFGVKDLLEMKKVGSTNRVNILAEFDRMSDLVTRRYAISADRTLDQDCVQQIPEVNTGDPQALVDFCSWAMQNYPAEHYALILWNHGAGWKDDDVYRSAQKSGVERLISRRQVRGLASGKSSRALFSNTLQHIVSEIVQNQRAILFDDTSADFLDNHELKRVLNVVCQKIGSQLDLLGFDACLMNMLEVIYQVRDTARIVVGSQETEPGNGWPYDTLLEKLVQQPSMSAFTLGGEIVKTYLDYYQTNYPQFPTTQSAVDASRIEPLAKAVGELGSVLSSLLGETSTRSMTLGLVFSALRQAQSFSDRDYVDLLHFCRLLAEQDTENSTGIHSAAQEVVEILEHPASPIVSAGQHGPGMFQAHGLSIYLPARTFSSLYEQLDFAQEHQWDEFLQAFVDS
jgi:hypothetical protein